MLKPESAVLARATSIGANLTSKELLFDETKVHMLPQAIMGVAATDLEIEHRLQQEKESLAHDDGYWYPSDHWMANYRPYKVVDGVLHIPIYGVLLNRYPNVIGRYATGYTYIRRAFERGLADGNVRGIALIVDSPGGEAAGNFELAEFIAENRGVKPIRSFVADYALSGGYSLATAAKQVVITRSGFSGSIGVISAHYDWSKAYEDFGVKVTLVYAGKHKADRSPYQPLSEQAEAGMRNRVNKIYDIFVSTVAKNRNMGEDAVRKTEADIFDSEDSVELGLVDKIGSDDDEIDLFATELAEGSGDIDMSVKDEVKTFTQEEVEAMVAKASETAKSEGVKEGVASERKRWADVMALDETKGREGAAVKLATNTDMNSEQIKETLAALPSTIKTESVETKNEPQGKSAFEKAMDDGDNPNVGAGNENDGDERTEAEDIVASFKLASGIKPKAKKAA